MPAVRLLLIAFFAVVFVSGTASADIKVFKATLDGASEVPPTTSKGKGVATVRFNTATKKITWYVRYSGMTGPVMAAHIHGPAEAGANAAVVVPFGGKLTSPIRGSASLTDDQAADLQAGKYYINLHTAANKGGEIRGQLEAPK
jgi:CHRD domain